MLDPVADLYRYLILQSDITDTLALYNGGPAIFAAQLPPDHQITDPVVILDYPTGGERFQTSSSMSRTIETSLRIYAQVHSAQGFNSLPLQQASEAIADALVTARIAVTGGVLRGANIFGPINVPTEDQTLAGRLVKIRWFIEENII